MKIIYNSILPFKGYAAINLFGVIFARRDTVVTPRLVNHESIHTAQMKELLYVPFYVLYALEWAVKLCACGNVRQAYRNISFEREAYANDHIPGYVKHHRRPFAFLKYIR